MPRLAANLSMLFAEVPFTERFRAAAKAGFTGVEYLHPYAERAEDIADRLKENGLTQVLFNFPPGDWEAGDRGIAGLPERSSEFRHGVGLAIEYAVATGCRRLHAMAGLMRDADKTGMHLDTYAANVQFAADAAAEHGIDIMVEAINSRVDMPGYIVDTVDKVLTVVDAIDRPNVYIQYDVYHMQIMHGDLTRSIDRLLPRIGHIQLADNPGRHEPGTGEIDYGWLLAYVDAAGYTGWVGCEYRPAGDTAAGLSWAADWL